MNQRNASARQQNGAKRAAASARRSTRNIGEDRRSFARSLARSSQRLVFVRKNKQMARIESLQYFRMASLVYILTVEKAHANNLWLQFLCRKLIELYA